MHRERKTKSLAFVGDETHESIPRLAQTLDLRRNARPRFAILSVEEKYARDPGVLDRLEICGDARFRDVTADKKDIRLRSVRHGRIAKLAFGSATRRGAAYKRTLR